MKMMLTFVFALTIFRTQAQEVAGRQQRGAGDGSGHTTLNIADDMVSHPAKPTQTAAKPLVDKDYPGRHILTREEISRMPATNLNDMLAIFPGIYQQRRGDDLSIFGSRPDGNHYYIDGMQ